MVQLRDTDEGRENTVKLPDVAPVIVLRRTAAFPMMILPLAVNREQDTRAVDRAVSGERLLVLVAEVEDEEGKASLPVPGIAVAAVLQKMVQMPDESRRLVLRTVARVQVLEITESEGVLMARIAPVEEKEARGSDAEALSHALMNAFRRIVELSPYLPEEAYIQALNVGSTSVLCDLIASALPLSVSEQQQVLNALDVEERLKIVNTFAQRTLTQLEVANKVGSDSRE